MPALEIPRFFAQVPQNLIALSAEDSAVLCNLRPEQRLIRQWPPLTTDERALHEIASHRFGFYIAPAVAEFLELYKLGSKALLHFQGFAREDVGTAVVQVDAVGWVEEESYPYLILRSPKVLHPVYGRQINWGGSMRQILWGGFILALMPAARSAEMPALRDEDASKFVGLAQQFQALTTTD